MARYKIWTDLLKIGPIGPYNLFEPDNIFACLFGCCVVYSCATNTLETLLILNVSWFWKWVSSKLAIVVSI